MSPSARLPHATSRIIRPGDPVPDDRETGDSTVNKRATGRTQDLADVEWLEGDVGD
jgi:hypothetical protein